MTSDDIKRFETLLDLTSHPGWALLLDEYDFKIEAIKDGFTQFGITEGILAYGQGRISVYRELSSMGPILRNALDNQKEDNEPDSV